MSYAITLNVLLSHALAYVLFRSGIVSHFVASDVIAGDVIMFVALTCVSHDSFKYIASDVIVSNAVTLIAILSNSFAWDFTEVNSVTLFSVGCFSGLRCCVCCYCV